MKKLITCLLFATFLFSCKDNTLLYSCDPVLNEIVTEHLQEYVSYTIQDIGNKSFPVQQAIFRTYTPQKKREIWLGKINWLLKNENYSSKEYFHVGKLLKMLTENYFDPDTLKATVSEREQFKTAWINYSTDSLGWTKSKIIFTAYRLYTDPLKYKAETEALASLRSKAAADGENNCNCGGSGDCGSGLMCSDSTSCSATSSGCGWFMTSGCTGICQ